MRRRILVLQDTYVTVHYRKPKPQFIHGTRRTAASVCDGRHVGVYERAHECVSQPSGRSASCKKKN